MFFVQGVDKARIILDEENGTIGHRYATALTPEQYPKFRDTFNNLRQQLIEEEAKQG